MVKKIISFQGLEGAYSELVCRKFYKDYKTIPCDTFQKTLDVVTDGKAELAMIPVENNIAGRVADMHFLLENLKLKVVAEYYHKIEHCLLANKRSTIKKITKVLSHTHALGQCTNNIKKLNLIAINFMDTAGAAKFVRENNDQNMSAIASTLAAKIYDLKILKKNFADKKENITRFLVFSKKSNTLNISGRIITSIVFNTKNVPAALYNALGGFAKNGINLTRLESFFVNKDFKQFSFIIDVESHPDVNNFKNAIKILKSYSTKVRILGFYKASSFRK
ncbi:MAG: prephenate dehydratase domain-containing protein [Alphaproteobacteria bacterium]